MKLKPVTSKPGPLSPGLLCKKRRLRKNPILLKIPKNLTVNFKSKTLGKWDLVMETTPSPIYL